MTAEQYIDAINGKMEALQEQIARMKRAQEPFTCDQQTAMVQVVWGLDLDADFKKPNFVFVFTPKQVEGPPMRTTKEEAVDFLKCLCDMFPCEVNEYMNSKREVRKAVIGDPT